QLITAPAVMSCVPFPARHVVQQHHRCDNERQSNEHGDDCQTGGAPLAQGGPPLLLGVEHTAGRNWAANESHTVNSPDAEPTAEADRGRRLGFPRFNVLAGGPGSLAERSADPACSTAPHFCGAAFHSSIGPTDRAWGNGSSGRAHAVLSSSPSRSL